MKVQPPGPILQFINALIHKEPVWTIVHAGFWSCVFAIATPISILALQISCAWKLFLWFTGLDARHEYDPENRSGEELAVVVTGCDTGFGKELAIVAAQEGYYVFACCLQKESFAQFEYTNQIIPLQVDVTNDESVEAAAKEVHQWIHEKTNSTTSPKRILHALCNNAGLGLGSVVDWTALATFQKVMDVNFFGIVRCCKAFLPIFKAQAAKDRYEGGRIFNVASMAGIVKAAPGMSAYSSSKFAAVAVSSALRQELAPFGVQVCTVCPSFHGTPMVHNMHDVAHELWEGMPKDRQEEYGKESMDQVLTMMDKAHQWTWDLKVVIDEIMKGFKCKRVGAEMMIGTDARFVYLLVNMLPTWVVHIMYNINAPAVVPRIMREKK